MLNSIAIYTKNDPKTHELYEFLGKVAPCSVYLNPDVKSVKTSLVLTDHYNRYFFNLDNSNDIIFLCRKDHLNNSELLLLPILKTIIANTAHEAVQISWQLRHKRAHIQVSHLLPWSKATKIEEGPPYFLSLNDRYKRAFFGHVVQNENPNTLIRIYLNDLDEEWPNNIIEGMLSGAVVIAPDRSPFNEFIVNGHNGYLIRNPGDVVDALKGIEDNKEWISYQAKSTMNAIFNPTRYLESLLHSEQLPNLNQFKEVPIEYADRAWLVRERSLAGGKISYYPENFSPKYTLVDFNNVNEILNYFVTQHFSEIYVFGCNVPDELSASDELILRRMLAKMGSRAMKIHFCRDEPIPDTWERIFGRLSIVSVEEGLKQVSS